MSSSHPGRVGGDEPNRSGWVCFVGALALGTYWMLIEFAVGFDARALFDWNADFGRLLRYLPAQLALFATIGLPLAALVRWTRIPSDWIVWLLFGTTMIAFLGPAAALGAFRGSRAVSHAALTLATVTVAVALLLATVAWIRRFLPERLRRAWPIAVVVGASLFVAPLISRASAPLRLGNVSFVEILAMTRPLDVAAALAATGAILLIGPLREMIGARSAGLAAGIAVGLCLIGSTPPRPAVADVVAGGADAGGAPDVIVILIDTLRPDVLGAYGRTPSITPHLDAIAAESIVFERAYSGANRTARSMPVVMTSLSPTVVGERIAVEADTLAEQLKAARYRTYGISANPFVSDFYGYAQGFDGFHDPTVAPEFLIMSPLKVIGRFLAGGAYRLGLISAELYYPTVAEIRTRATGILEETPSPLFLYLHTMDVHGPYLPPRRFLPPDYEDDDFISYYDLLAIAGDTQALSQPTVRDQLRNARQRYEGELRFTDEELGRFVDFLRRNGRWDESVVWVISDHGEAFGEHAWAGHAGFNVYSTLLRVPMFVKPPRSAGVAPRVVDTPVSNADIVPTTLALLGLDPPATTFGIDLLDTTRAAGRPPDSDIVSDVLSPDGRILSLVRGPWKLDAALSSETGDVEARALYDLVADPRERVDLLDRHADLAETLLDALWQRVEAERRLSVRSDTGALDAEMKERLRSLGYVVD